MLIPAWSPFPERRWAGFTSILLQLSPEVDSGKLVQELMDIDGRLLMFLRNIKQLEIEVVSSDKRSAGYSTLLKRKTKLYEGREVCVIEPDTSTYLMFRHAVSKMPVEDKRKGCKSSEIVLAFPVDLQHAVPSIPSKGAPNRVYSFLPIRDYGFKVCTAAACILSGSYLDSWSNLLLVYSTSRLHTCVKPRGDRA